MAESERALVQLLLFIAAGMLAGGVMGAIVGSAKGNGAAGFVLGFLFSVLGIVIAAMLKDERKKCPRCAAVLPEGKVTSCRACGAMLRRKGLAGGGMDPVEAWEARERARQNQDDF
jgi:hypothetical protein